jgi:autotransporter translocation and assembly factor TamB
MAPLMGDQLTLAGVIDYDGKATVRVDKLHLSAAIGEISGSGSLDSTTQRVGGQFHLTLPDLHPAEALLGEPLAGRLEIAATIAGTLAAPTASLDLRSDGLHLSDLSLDGLTARLQLALAEKQGQRQWKAEGKGRLTGLARRDAPLPAALDRDFDWSLRGAFDETDLSLDIAALTLEGTSLKLNGRGRWARKGRAANRADIAALDRFADLAELPALAGSLHLEADISATPAGAASVVLRPARKTSSSAALADALLGPG